jgi:hypothetical protein
LVSGKEYFWRITARERNTDKQKEEKSPIWSFETMGTDSYKITVQSTPSIAGDVRIGKGKWGYLDEAVVDKNETVTIEYREDKDYTFAGWYEKGEQIGDDYEIEILADEDKVIGKVQGSISSLGNILGKMKNRYVLFFLLVVPLSVVMFFEIKHLKNVLKSEDDPENLDDNSLDEPPAAEPDTSGQESDENELLDKINRIQAKIDKINPKSDELPKEE